MDAQQQEIKYQNKDTSQMQHSSGTEQQPDRTSQDTKAINDRHSVVENDSSCTQGLEGHSDPHKQQIKGQQKKQQKTEQKEKKQQKDYDDEIPEHFYDSDLASVNEKDFMSDNQPPKDIVHERKLLHKEKTLHIYKTIVRVGRNIDKPAPYDQITLRLREQPVTTAEGIEAAKNYEFIQSQKYETYNLGKKYMEIERLVTSMKEGETALFELEHLQVSKKTNIKVLREKVIYIIEVEKWTTVIDIGENGDFLKYMVRRGEGPYRVSKFDEVSLELSIRYRGVEIIKQSHKHLKLEREVIDAMPPVVWKVLSSMKKNECSCVRISDEVMRNACARPGVVGEGSQQADEDLSQYHKLVEMFELKSKQQIAQKQNEQWVIDIEIADLLSIDDIYMDGRLLKKMLVKGVSTAKPESSSFIYYALKFLDSNRKVLHEDACFNSDWWEDYSKLEELGCRKNYMDEYKMSKFLKSAMKRMKPAEISEIQCRDMLLFTFGHDYEELKALWPQDQEFPPKKVALVVRVYNFTEGKNCFNMALEEKVSQSRRIKAVAIKLLNKGKYEKAYKRFQTIVSFYGSGDISQAAYDEKISALMNSMICLSKQNKHAQVIPLCNMVLEKPKHGFNQDKMQIKAQGIKVEGNVQGNTVDNLDSREDANLEQNPKIIDKCLYRKAVALLKGGESIEALECIDKIVDQSEEVKGLRADAEKHLQNYREKSKKIFKSMFG